MEKRLTFKEAMEEAYKIQVKKSKKEFAAVEFLETVIVLKKIFNVSTEEALKAILSLGEAEYDKFCSILTLSKGDLA